MVKKPCIGCVYFETCGSTTRTEECAGRKTKTEQKKEGKQMTIYHVTELYNGNEKLFHVLPYDLKGTIHTYLRMRHGVYKLFQFLCNSRLTIEKARELKEDLEFEEFIKSKWRTEKVQ